VIYYVYINKETGVCQAYFNVEMHGEKTCQEVLDNGGARIDKELWIYLTSLDRVRFKGKANPKKLYMPEDKGLFEVVVEEAERGSTTLEERIAVLESMYLTGLIGGDM
jgi:hypothetical protein